jgi:RNA-binding protein Luc7-like 2
MSRKYREPLKSDLDLMREELDSLMGINRNNDRAGEVVSDFRDERVCKFYLLGMCPNEMFVNTKMDEGPCTRVHSDALKEEFERSGDTTIFDHNLEHELLKRISDVDRSIERARSRLDEEKVDDTTNPDLNPDVVAITTEIAKSSAEMDVAGEEGDIDLAQELMTKIEQLNRQKHDIISRLLDQRRANQAKTGMDVNKKLRVCDICGSYLSIFDSDKRLTDHFMGKQHIGFQTMRDYLQGIKERREQRRGAGGGADAGPDDRGDGRRDYGRGDGRDRDRDRDREYRDRDSRRDSRDRDRRRNRSSSRDRHRRGR